MISENKDVNVKKAVSLLLIGTKVTLASSYPGSTKGFLRVGESYFVTGVQGVLSGPSITDYDLFIQSCEGGHEGFYVPIEAFPTYFETV